MAFKLDKLHHKNNDTHPTTAGRVNINNLNYTWYKDEKEEDEEEKVLSLAIKDITLKIYSWFNGVNQIITTQT